MASRFWVGGTGNWNSTSHWSATSGGSSGASVPSSSDNVFIDTNSGISGGTITLNDNGATDNFCNNITSTTGVSYTITTTRTLIISGSITLESGITMTDGEQWQLFANSSVNINTAGVTMPYLFFNQNTPSGTYTLLNDLTIYSDSTFDFNGGTFNANGYNVKAGSFYFFSDASTTTVINMGAGTWEATGDDNTFGLATWWVDEATGFLATINSSTSTIKFTSNSTTDKTLLNTLDYPTVGGSKVYNNVWFNNSGTGSFILQNSNTYNEFKVDTPPHTVQFKNGTTSTVSTFTVNGTPSNLITLNSDTTATFSLIKSGTSLVSCNYLNIQHSVVTPANTWYAGNTSVNNQAVITAGSGWIFTAAPTTVPPTVTTQAVSSIANTTATGNGNVTDGGDSTVTQRGVCYSQFANPTTLNTTVVTTGTTGAFTASLTGLTAGTLYHVRAFATNGAGTGYGADVTFTTTNSATSSKIDQNDRPSWLAYNETTGSAQPIRVDAVLNYVEVYGVVRDTNTPTAINRAFIDGNERPTLLGYNETTGLVEALRCGSSGELLVKNVN